ncbi:ATP-binding protein [Candidatus Woesearchaeota archaeon]|nr:ATP-binding protein [Candidatus Woesearchaeota archaeon]
MEANEQIERFRVFIETYYKSKLYESIQQGKRSITLNFVDLMQFDHELSNDLLENPEDTIRAAELSLEQFDLGENYKNLRIRFNGLPITQRMKIGGVRSEHLGRFLMIEGIVRQASDVRPQVTSAKFECAGCGNTISILQIDTKFKEPSRCTCGWRGKFRLLTKDLIDVQHLKIEESPESLDGGEQPKRISVFLKEDLVEPYMEKKTTPGSRINIYGIVKEVPIQLKTGAQSVRYDLILEANNVESVQEDFSNIILAKEDLEQIKALAEDPKIFERFVKSIAPSIYGHEKIKEALVLQMLGGVRKEKPDKTTIRGDIHILLVGDPGSGKSALLQFISKAAPKARFVSGKGSSGAGLCVAPDSLILTNPGGIHKIKDIVEENLKDHGKLYTDNVWNSSNPYSDKKIFTLDENFKIKPKEIDQLWRIDPPECMVKITTQSGKQVIVTQNTKLYSHENSWKESSEFLEGEYLASSRNLNFPQNDNKIFTFDLIKSNPIIVNIKSKVKFLIDEICKNKKINKRILAKELGFSELSIYFNWVNKKARGNIKLNNLRKLAEYAGVKLENVIENNTKCSLYNGRYINIPKYIDGDFLYFAGLIVGDGDLTENNDNVTVRFSNRNATLINEFIKLSKKLFNINPNISSLNSEKRPEAWRFGSNLVFEILEELGIPLSPKSHKIDMSNKLLNINNFILSNYLRGYFDTDGGGIERTKKGSNYIESSSTSKIFSEKLKLVLLRYGIHSKIKEKDPRPNEKVNSKNKKYPIIISGKRNLELFREFIGFNHPDKKTKLDRIINKINKYDTNIDIIPSARILIKKIENDLKIKILKRSDKSGISRQYLQNLLKNLNHIEHDNIKTLKLLADSDIFWDKIIKIEFIKDHGYEYVYDLTVKDSHNFIVNGLLVHNTASVVKDEFLKGWALEAGALVLANKGICVCDELDKLDKDDTAALHSAMEQQIIPISKANIQSTLNSQTTLLAAANPKLGRFDPYTPIASQIDLPSTLLNRFDLIFPVRDIPNEEKDAKIALHVLDTSTKEETYKTDITPEILRKYITYVKQLIKPKLDKSAIEEIKNFYVTLRNSGKGEEGGVKPIPISARQLEGLIRLTEASARIRLREKATSEDAKRAIELLRYCLMQIGLDPETGQIDIDRVSGGITASTRGAVLSIREIIYNFEAKGIKPVSIDEIMAEAASKGIEETKVEEAINHLKKSGDIFEPKRGFISRVG